MAQSYGLDFTNEVFELAEGEWQGPFTSAVGTHFFRIQRRRPSRERSFEEVQDYLEQDYLSDDADRVVGAELERIRRRYRVEVEDVE